MYTFEDHLLRAVEIWDTAEFVTSKELEKHSASLYKQEEKFFMILYNKANSVEKVEELTEENAKKFFDNVIPVLKK
jgi:hypothetical protein